jgi:uncharacterized damage-inducible protein DinB
MYRKIEDFVKDWTTESESTLKTLKNLTDASLAQKVSPEGRSLGDIAWHLTTAVGEMMGRAGLSIESPADDAPAPSKAAEIVAVYEAAARSLSQAICQKWNDASLLDELDMYGEKWARGYTLSVMMNHQTHHRGQMTVLMRQAGLKVPGVCGPSREEWAQFGMPPAK